MVSDQSLQAAMPAEQREKEREREQEGQTVLLVEEAVHGLWLWARMSLMSEWHGWLVLECRAKPRPSVGQPVRMHAPFAL